MSDDDDWEGYSSEFMFPSTDTPCTCPLDDNGDPIHDATQHGYSGCEADLPDGNECPCEAYWEHT